MNLSQIETTVVRRLRLRAPSKDLINARLRMGRILSTADLTPASLPPSAIVVVRKLRDPLPRVLVLDDKTAIAPTRWRRAVASAVNDVATTAARPVLGPVPADARAVLFMDRSELLACLAMDWSHGDIAARWWWQALRVADLNSSLLRTFLEQPEYIPSAMDQLARAGSIVDVVRMFRGDECHAVIDAVATAFAIQEIHILLGPLMVHDALRTRGEADDAGPMRYVAFETSAATSARSQPAPWVTCAPEGVSPEITFEQQCLVGITLGLARAPAFVRSTRFLVALDEWVRAIIHRPAEIQNDEHMIVQELDDTPVSADLATSRPGKSAGPVPGLPAVAQIKGSEFPKLEETNPGEFAAPPLMRPELRAGPAVAAATGVPAESPAITLDLSPAGQMESERHRGLPPIEFEIETDLGGSFYLINVGIALNLYGDFTSPAEPGIPLPIWDFIALIADRLLVDRKPDDPLWRLLADLSGRRHDEPPGKDFDRPLEEWLDELMPRVRPYLPDLANSLCERHARIVTTPAHLDVFFALQSLSVEIRVAGLDRNPGWVPAAGRFIAFHYE